MAKVLIPDVDDKLYKRYIEATKKLGNLKDLKLMSINRIIFEQAITDIISKARKKKNKKAS